jgi:hypothetical protein
VYAGKPAYVCMHNMVSFPAYVCMHNMVSGFPAYIEVGEMIFDDRLKASLPEKLASMVFRR